MNWAILNIKKYELKHSQNIVLVLLCLVFFGCNSESAPDCFQNGGDIIREEITLPNFNKITVLERVALVLKEGAEQKVEIETGEFLREEVSAIVEGDRLVLKNENSCNFFREFGLTTIYVTSPNITQIRSNTGLKISSDGVLSYPELVLLSESFTDMELDTTDGEFDLNLNSTNVSVTSNGIAFFKLSGATENLNLVVAAGDSRIEATNLIAQNVSLNHRGSNDMLINPQESLSGVIRGTGDVLSFNSPDNIEVEELFRGRLLFR